MTEIKEFNLIDAKNNSNIISNLNNIYKLWGYEEVSPSFINTLETIKGRGVIEENEVIGIVSSNSLCLRPEMTTSIVKLSSTRLINKKRPIRLFTNGIVFDKKLNNKNSFKLQEKLQSGIELIGYDTKYPEIEVINILFDAIDKINLKDGCNLYLLVSTTKIMDLVLNKYKNNNFEEIKKSLVNFDQDKLSKLGIEDDDKYILRDLLFTRGEPNAILKKLKGIYGTSKSLDDLNFLFKTLSKISNKYGVKLQLDPTFQPHLNLYEGIVFQLIGHSGNNKTVIAKGGRYDELVRFFNPNEKILNGIGFTISIDILRNLIKEEITDKKKILLMFKDSSLLEKGMNEQKELQKRGYIAVLHLNPCDDLVKANQIMNENNCTEILWIK
ncbi:MULTISPECIES: ATP phosphoribosyltransferase regulatory subunit [Prochlorococcus]|uniref:ATP phosphoribosyltransferase regulatory subunit n=1 Tax=Prochlorococcus marinus str. MIT 9116 TaxID=167544 RepID=A0A0A1ZPD9_PROMR|nr:ATP phosphoribosyltransferase regulatory subunit [Prochlorococcus marinus]KGF89585.1 ATP phosphoribosyltransferase regulatory subunit [Prochlorococcus marinus str. MIT 9107]KGF90406.1 ATP phosphoribosyltransferase regulatory subunit [Prochlorococcus marinus str. MIT 9116]KGF92885.1 ATP phosphoribosyltransferase regulatory subunit [Prochlorococcus marinus str. MIT 9123]